MNVILKSKAFWSALLAFAGVIVMRYTQVPAEIWESFVGLAIVVVGLFAADEAAKTVGVTLARTMKEK